MYTKEYFINEFLAFDDKENVDEHINRLETYISESGYDLQLKLILYYYQGLKADDLENNYNKACEFSALALDLLKTTSWGWLELQVLASAISRAPHYTTSWEFMQKALKVLDDKFVNHENYEYSKFRLYGNLTWRLIRARYYDDADPADIQNKFDQCIKEAITFCEKMDYKIYRLVLLVRQAVFYGDSDKILKYVHELEATRDKIWIRTTKDEVVEYFLCLGSNVTTDLKNLIVGWQMHKRRIELRMKAAELAKAAGVRHATINLYERGERGAVYAKLCKIANALNVDVSYFYGEASTESLNATTDITTHKLIQLMAQMSENEKNYLLESARLIMKFNHIDHTEE